MRVLVAGLLSVIAIAASVFYWYWRFKPAPEPFTKPNILVISTCSLRHDAVEYMPNVRRFFDQGSFQFPNAFNGLGWTAIFAVTAPEIRRRWFDQVGYRAAGLLVKNHMYLIPPRNSWKEGFTREDKKKGLAPPDSNFEKNYREGLDFFIDTVARPTHLPFFVIGQLKYAHYPLIDKFNSDSKWDQFLSDDEKKRIKTYLANPKRYADKLPFLLMLTNDSALLRAHPRIGIALKGESPEGGHDNAFLGLLNTPSFLRDWTRSKDYEADLEILKKIYRANVVYMDGMIAEMLERMEARGDLDNTVVIFVGDHGEVHMERGHLTHGTSWFDPALRVPLMIRFPKQKSSTTISAQTNFFTLTKMITSIAEGKINSANFVEVAEELADPVVIARDCSNTWRAIRYDNKWKYIVDNSSGESWLFDLENDPGETQNRVGDFPEVVADMEARYWEKLPELSRQMVNSCKRWPGKQGERERRSFN